MNFNRSQIKDAVLTAGEQPEGFSIQAFAKSLHTARHRVSKVVYRLQRQGFLVKRGWTWHTVTPQPTLEDVMVGEVAEVTPVGPTLVESEQLPFAAMPPEPTNVQAFRDAFRGGAREVELHLQDGSVLIARK